MVLLTAGLHAAIWDILVNRQGFFEWLIKRDWRQHESKSFPNLSKEEATDLKEYLIVIAVPQIDKEMVKS